MAFAEIPTQEDFKRACGRIGPRALFKKKKDLDPIFTALHLAEPHRRSSLPQAIPFLRKVRKECCGWISRNESVVRVSAPKVKDKSETIATHAPSGQSCSRVLQNSPSHVHREAGSEIVGSRWNTMHGYNSRTLIESKDFGRQDCPRWQRDGSTLGTRRRSEHD